MQIAEEFPVKHGMPVALLTAGASLSRVWSESMASEYGYVLAVNRAAKSFSCDFLCHIDSFVYEWMMAEAWPRPRIGYLTTHRRILKVPDKPRFAMHLYAQNQPGQSLRCRKTFPCALYEAACFADQAGSWVDVFGLDMSDDRGHYGDATYDWRRWSVEAQWMALAWPRHCRVFGDIAPALLSSIEALATARPLEDFANV